MQLAHLKTSPVVVLGPLDLLEWPNETFAVGQHHQFCLTKERLSLKAISASADMLNAQKEAAE